MQIRDAKIYFAILIVSVVRSSLASAEPFEYKGKPIHPGCVYELAASLVDYTPLGPAAILPDKYPVKAAVDLEGCVRSNKFCCGDLTEDKGLLTYRSKFVFGEGCYFAYKLLGQTQNSIFVLHAYWKGSDGMFEHLYFVRFTDAKVQEASSVNSRRGGDRIRDQELLKCVGHAVLGEKFDGKIAVQGNTVEIVPAAGAKARVLDLTGF